MKTITISILIFFMVFTVNAQEDEIEWEAGGGLRFNYLGLSGGFSGYNAENGRTYDLDYHAIGMDNYAPSLALAMGGRYEKWNFAFAASRGTYTGSFITKYEIDRDGVYIPVGSEVDGKIDMGIYSLTTTYLFYEEQHDAGAGLGFLVLNMGSEYKTEDVVSVSNHWFPMPFLALSGKLDFDEFKFSGSGGGAYFNGKKDDLDFEVYYITFDVRGIYEFYKEDNWTWTTSLGYRYMFMDSKAKRDDGTWFKEKDIYQGPFVSIRVKYTVLKSSE